MINDLLPLPHYKCPKCKSQLNVVRENINQEECIDVYKCSKCDYVYRRTDSSYVLHPGKPSLELSMRKTISKYSGDIGEAAAKKLLLHRNFSVIDFVPYASFLGTDFEIPRENSHAGSILRDFFDEEHLKRLSEFCKAWSEDPEAESGKITKYHIFSAGWNTNPEKLTRSSNFGPDLIGRKDGKFYLIEVKANKAPLPKFQKKMLLRAKDFDFIPLVVRVKVNLEIPLDKIEFEKL